jgi:hypothetical protein
MVNAFQLSAGAKIPGRIPRTGDPASITGRRTWVVLALGLATLLPSCAYSKPNWREETFEDIRFEQLWNALNESLRACGYAPDHAATDRGQRKLVSRWRTRELPFRGGERTRVVAEVVTPSTAETGLELRFHVERQVNKSMATAFGAEESDWKASGQEEAVEARLLKHIKLRTTQPGAEGTASEASSNKGR